MEWISVDDGLPGLNSGLPYSRRVLVFSKSKVEDYIDIAHWHFKSQEWSSRHGSITHWMPLPSPPEEEDDG